jgi:glutathionylspermidine synthase
MMSEETLEELKCALSGEEHFVIEPITLTNCGHSICYKCIPKDNVNKIECKLCGLVTEQDFSKVQISKASQKLLKMCLEDIFKILEADTSLKLNEIKGILNY